MAHILVGRRELLSVAAIAAAGTCLPSYLYASGRRSTFNPRLHSPEEVGMSSAGLEGVRATIQKLIDQKVIPGAVTAIARHNKLVLFEAQGMQNVSAGASMQEDALFHMASSTKNLTAAAVMMMEEAGKLALNHKVSRYVSTFGNPMVAMAPPAGKDASQVKMVPADREITILDLITHTSGLSSIGDDPKSAGLGSLINKIDRNRDDTLGDYVARVGRSVLDFQPGTKFRYSPLDGFDVLLRIVELTSGYPADVFLRERIWQPLDMEFTFYNVPAVLQSKVVTIYGPYNESWPVVPSFSGPPMIFSDEPTKYFSGSAGLKSTAHDFMQFEQMMLNGGVLNNRRLLKSETVANMTRNHVGRLFADWYPSMTAGLGFGLGMSVVIDPAKGNGRSAGSFGWGGGYGTESWADPELDVAAAMFIQMAPPPERVKVDFQEALKKAIVA